MWPRESPGGTEWGWASWASARPCKEQGEPWATCPTQSCEADHLNDLAPESPTSLISCFFLWVPELISPPAPVPSSLNLPSFPSRSASTEDHPQSITPSLWEHTFKGLSSLGGGVISSASRLHRCESCLCHSPASVTSGKSLDLSFHICKMR